MASYGPGSGRSRAAAQGPVVPLGPVLEHYGVALKGDRYEEQVHCCVHGETRPSLTVNVEKGVAFCFACNFKGNAIHLVMAMESCDREAAEAKVEKILRSAGVETRRVNSGRYQRPDARGEARPSGGRKYVPPGRR